MTAGPTFRSVSFLSIPFRSLSVWARGALYLRMFLWLVFNEVLGMGEPRGTGLSVGRPGLGHGYT